MLSLFSPARIDSKLLSSNRETLQKWISEKAGCSNPEYFGCKKKGGLMLQQNSEEYSHYLDWLRKQQIRTYLEIGVADGGSFLVNVLFSGTKVATAVDNLSYEPFGVQKHANIRKRVEYLNKTGVDANLVISDSTVFLRENTRRFDMIFIDGDHSYEGVKSDYELSKPWADRFLVFHDISNGNTGVKQLWEEIRSDTDVEFIHNQNTGIGIKVLG